MSDQSSEDLGDEPRCSCRGWVERELARLRDEFATEVCTRHLRVAAEGGPAVVLEANGDLAVVRVETADGGVGAELMAAVEDTEGYAAVSLSARGDVVAVLSVLDAGESGPAVTRLVFDRPDTAGPWTIVDAEGIRRER